MASRGWRDDKILGCLFLSGRANDKTKAVVGFARRFRPRYAPRHAGTGLANLGQPSYFQLRSAAVLALGLGGLGLLVAYQAGGRRLGRGWLLGWLGFLTRSENGVQRGAFHARHEFHNA
jgi:hypothetical protein